MNSQPFGMISGEAGEHLGRYFLVASGDTLWFGSDKRNNVVIHGEKVSPLHFGISYDAENGCYWLLNESPYGIFSASGQTFPKGKEVRVSVGERLYLDGNAFYLQENREREKSEPETNAARVGPAWTANTDTAAPNTGTKTWAADTEANTATATTGAKAATATAGIVGGITDTVTRTVEAEKARNVGPCEQKARKGIMVGCIVMGIFAIIFLVLTAPSGDMTPGMMLLAFVELVFTGAVYGFGFPFGIESIKKWTLKGVEVAGVISFWTWVKMLLWPEDSDRHLAGGITGVLLAIAAGLTIGWLIGIGKGVKAIRAERREMADKK